MCLQNTPDGILTGGCGGRGWVYRVFRIAALNLCESGRDTNVGWRLFQDFIVRGKKEFLYKSSLEDGTSN